MKYIIITFLIFFATCLTIVGFKDAPPIPPSSAFQIQMQTGTIPRKLQNQYYKQFSQFGCNYILVTDIDKQYVSMACIDVNVSD